MTEHFYKVGETVRITGAQGGAPVGTLVEITALRPNMSGITYRYDRNGNGKMSGGWVADFDSIEHTNTDPAPAFLSDYEAQTGVSFRLEGGETIEIKANLTKAQAKANIESEVIYMSAFDRNDDIYMGLTIDEAKQVAVALFNQILYHESLRD